MGSLDGRIVGQVRIPRCFKPGAVVFYDAERRLCKAVPLNIFRPKAHALYVSTTWTRGICGVGRLSLDDSK